MKNRLADNHKEAGCACQGVFKTKHSSDEADELAEFINKMKAEKS
jgi:hypothetical protein